MRDVLSAEAVRASAEAIKIVVGLPNTDREPIIGAARETVQGRLDSQALAKVGSTRIGKSRGEKQAHPRPHGWPRRLSPMENSRSYVRLLAFLEERSPRDLGRHIIWGAWRKMTSFE